MDERIYRGYLFDFYGELLNEHQKDIYEAYITDDMSLTELAQMEGTTRQAAHDIIKRCTAKLESYENRLGLVNKFMHIKKNISEIEALTRQEPTVDTLSTIEKISKSILEEL